MEQRKCSIIVPVYYNAGSLELLFSVIQKNVITKFINLCFEVIFVDDGSGDNSFQILQSMQNSNPKIIRVIKFTRNFGQYAAITSGLKFCSGDFAVVISADLQDDPSLINNMISEYTNDYDVIIATREDREESFYRKMTSRFFYSMMKKLCFNNMPTGGYDYFLISRKVIDFMVNNIETNPFIQGQILWSGFSVKFIKYTRKKRVYGKSRWTFAKKVKWLIDGLLGYSYFPIRLISVVGGIIALSGFIYALTIVYDRLIGNVPFNGWAPIMILILVLSGFQMIMLGIIGEYLWRTLDQVRRRPLYIVQEIIADNDK